MSSSVKSFISSLWARVRGTYGVDLIPEGASSGAYPDAVPQSPSPHSSGSRAQGYAAKLMRSLNPRDVDEARKLAISGWRSLQAMPEGSQISGHVALAVNAEDVEGAVDVLVKRAGYRRRDAVAFVAALMIVTASGRQVLDEAEEADCEYRQLISRGLPPLDSDEVAMLWNGEADAACARYRRRSGASEDDARTMIHLAAKIAAAEGDLPQ